MKKTNFFIGACITLMLITMSFSLTVVAPPLAIIVDVDIKPGSCPNPLMTRSRGVLPIAICGTEDFDVTQIDPVTIEINLNCFGVSPLRWSYYDEATPFDGELCDCHEVGADGYLDLILKYKTQELLFALGLVSDGDVITLDLTGNLMEEHGGTPIQGSDCIVIIDK